MLAERYEMFASGYRRNLIVAVNESPEQYAVGKLGFSSNPTEYAETTADKMLTAIMERGIGSVNKDSVAFKRTCKELGIKHTYKAIEAFLNGED